jgi:hypothetical protein
VTMPGTSFSVMYTKTDDNTLIANGFTSKKLEHAQRGPLLCVQCLVLTRQARVSDSAAHPYQNGSRADGC